MIRSGGIADRFKEEKLPDHWQVDETRESLERLFYHLEVKTNFKPYFEKALRSLELDGDKLAKGLVAADIGAGACWTSAILAKHPKVKLVYAVDPSENRLKHARFVIRHAGAEDKVRIIRGTFQEPNIPEKVDLVLLCGSLHHCYDEHIESLFSNIKALLKPGGRVLVANEHYVDWMWLMKRLSKKRLLKHLLRFYDLAGFYSYLNTLQAPDPFDGEHWRTKRELEKIFTANGFTARFFVHEGDLCKDKPTFYSRLGWHYYHAILGVRNDKT